VRLTRLVAVPLVVTTALGCHFNAKAGYYADDKKAAVAALDVFHQRLSAGDFDSIYDSASDALRARPKGELIAAMRSTRDTWGKLIRSEVKSSSCFPNEVRLIVEAQYEKGLAGEMFIWEVPDDRARLQHFQIYPGPAVLAPDGAANECRSTE
jgi:hypothetical protein